MATKALGASSTTPVWSSFIQGEKGQMGLALVMSCAAVLSLIPPTRVAGGLLFRACMLPTTLKEAGAAVKAGNNTTVIMQSIRIGGLVLGTVGLLAASPILLTASVVADLGFQTIGLGKAMYNKEWSKAGYHASMIVIDSLTITAMVTGSWKLMMVTVLVSIFVIGALATSRLVTLAKQDRTAKMQNITSDVCFIVTAASYFFASTASMATLGFGLSNAERYNFNLKNDSEDVMYVITRDPHGETGVEGILSYVAPGKELDLSLRPDEIIYDGYQVLTPSVGIWTDHQEYHFVPYDSRSLIPDKMELASGPGMIGAISASALYRGDSKKE